MQPSHLTPVDGDMPDYPVSVEERIDSHYFIAWERRRWLNSDMRLKARPECRALYFDLICISYEQSPLGTIPKDMVVLAKLLHVDLGYLQDLCRLEFGPLHNWYPVRCDNGDVRMAHRFVTRVLVDAISRKEDNRAKTEAANVSKRLQRLRGTVSGLHAELAKNDAAILWMDKWLSDQGVGYRSVDWIEKAMGAWSNHALDSGLRRQRGTS
jgi:hypothetical protein